MMLRRSSVSGRLSVENYTHSDSDYHDKLSIEPMWWLDFELWMLVEVRRPARCEFLARVYISYILRKLFTLATQGLKVLISYAVMGLYSACVVGVTSLCVAPPRMSPNGIPHR